MPHIAQSPRAHLNRIGCATPPHDIHQGFVGLGAGMLANERTRALFARMAQRAGIAHRYSTLGIAPPGSNAADSEGFYRRGQFPSTAARMQRYDAAALPLAMRAVEQLDIGDTAGITHLIVASCTGFAAPGLDLQIVDGLGLKSTVERTLVGFMGCYAAINALKLSRHIVRSEPKAKVLVLSLELCTLHLQETSDLEQVLSFLVFGDGCAAALISSEPTGLELERFHAEMAPAMADQITWNIGDTGFDMYLSGQVPASLRHALTEGRERILDEASTDAFGLWAIHPGGRTVLDAVEAAFALPPEALSASREVLRRFGNMSSATVLFVLKTLLDHPQEKGARGCAMAFGPGLTAETMLFSQA